MAGEDFSQRASHDRLSAITDGVYAVALTLLALEIVVPSVNSIHSSSQLNIYVLKDRKSTRLNSSHYQQSRMPSSA